MNIFILSQDPVTAAQMQCNKHIPKMIVESAQMLCTSHRRLDGSPDRRPSKSGKTMVQYWQLPDEREDIFYKAVHMFHPCTVWTMENVMNYYWHYDHFVALCDEYTHRYGKVHASDKLLRDRLKRYPVNIDMKNHMSPFPLAMKSNPECIALKDPVKAYQAFYQTKQHRFKMEWTGRPVPDWFQVA